MNVTLPLTASSRRLQGVVVSTAMQKTAVVNVDRRVPHSKYGKYFTISKKFKVHDPERVAQVGDTVEFAECRPLSRDKRWVYVRTVASAK
jgi:small subunit ribosomal protein S17